jgi:catechol 2,3-dioxygenase-like lactoylglutathione lyase family enzyme
LRCNEDEVESVREFYESVLGLQLGPRPSFGVPGYWLYSGSEPIVHLVATGRNGTPAGTSYDHVAFYAEDLAKTREVLNGRGIKFDETPVIETTLYQIQFNDPLGVKLELTFDLDSEA